ncbi:MAG: CRISPR-associated endonuclease Cas1 [Rhodothermales bacterium]
MTPYDEIASYPCLLEGWERTLKNSGMPGSDGVSVRMVALRLEHELATLQEELQARTYTPRPLLGLDIPKPNGGFRRLAIPAVRDRVAQSAALVVLQPLIERDLEKCSFAYRPGLSYHDAIRRLRVLRDEGYQWVVDADIASFFDEVSHEGLLARFAELVPDPDTVDLVRKWIATDVMIGRERIRRTEGLPQGAVVSPLLANLYLDRFDEALLARGLKLIRYADDFVILCRTQPRAEQALRLTENLLHDLELRLHPEKTRITSFEQGFRFLGSLFVRSLILPSKHKSLEAVPPATTSVPRPDTKLEDAAPPVPPVPDRAELEHTALGRAFLRALDAEGVSLTAFVGALTGPAFEEETNVPAVLALSEAELPDFDEPTPLKPGAEPFMRTLYIQEQGAWLRVNRGRFIVTDGREPKDELAALPAIKVDQIMIFGHCLITPAALRYCLQQAIPITLLSSRGRYYGQVEATTARSVARQRLQFLQALDAPFRLDLARRLVEAKLHNTRSLVRRYARRLRHERLVRAARDLTRLLRPLAQAETLDQVRGYEGQGGALYFNVFDLLLTGSDFTFESRTRRPPLDPVNAMLSFGYTLLFNNLYAMVRLHRMNPYVGFFHDERAGHPAFVSDLIEEFRFLIERMVLALCNKRRLKPDDFHYPDDREGCFLTDTARKTFIRAFEHAMHRKVTHPPSGRTVTYRQCLDLQVRAFADHIEGKAPYTPFKSF